MKDSTFLKIVIKLPCIEYRIESNNCCIVKILNILEI